MSVLPLSLKIPFNQCPSHSKVMIKHQPCGGWVLGAGDRTVSTTGLVLPSKPNGGDTRIVTIEALQLSGRYCGEQRHISWDRRGGEGIKSILFSKRFTDVQPTLPSKAVQSKSWLSSASVLLLLPERR